MGILCTGSGGLVHRRLPRVFSGFNSGILHEGKRYPIDRVDAKDDEQRPGARYKGEFIPGTWTDHDSVECTKNHDSDSQGVSYEPAWVDFTPEKENGLSDAIKAVALRTLQAMHTELGAVRRGTSDTPNARGASIIIDAWLREGNVELQNLEKTELTYVHVQSLMNKYSAKVTKEARPGPSWVQVPTRMLRLSTEQVKELRSRAKKYWKAKADQKN